MKRDWPTKAPSLADDLNRFRMWLHCPNTEMVMAATIDSIRPLYRSNPRVLETELLARQAALRRQANG